MNTKEASKKWGVSISAVCKYCAEGMVLFVEKKKIGWDIPDEAEKPLVSRSVACKLMVSIEAYQNGGNPSFKGRGFSISNLVEYYSYLADNAFITGLQEGTTLSDKLRDVKILQRGLNLIESHNASNSQHKYNVSASIKGEVTRGPLKISGSVDVDNKA